MDVLLHYSISAWPGVNADQLREKFWLDPVIHLSRTVVSTPVCGTGDLGSNPGPGENFSLKLTI